jgi:tetratricopeptide (TPR) repeat protein
MQFDPDNKIVQLCAKGMEMELAKKPNEAKALFLLAWDEAATDFEKFTAAHYVARHQSSVADKLKWDETALAFAFKIDDPDMKANYPSLYLNIAKGYEDLNDFERAAQHYQTALSFADDLPENSYGQIIKSGIQNGLARVADGNACPNT